MFHGVESLKLQYKGIQGYLNAVEKEQIIINSMSILFLCLRDRWGYLKFGLF